MLKIKELESRLELEQATRGRIEVQCNRLKESHEKAQAEIALIKSKEVQSQETTKKLQKSLRFVFPNRNHNYFTFIFNIFSTEMFENNYKFHRIVKMII